MSIKDIAYAFAGLTLFALLIVVPEQKTAHAANFTFSQSGLTSLTSSTSPFAVYEDFMVGISLGDQCSYGNCTPVNLTNSYPDLSSAPAGFSPAGLGGPAACDYVLGRSGLNANTPKSCSYKTYSWQSNGAGWWAIWGAWSADVELYEGASIPVANTNCNYPPINTDPNNNVATSYGNLQCAVYTYAGTIQAPLASLTANPVTVVQGSSTLLTYSCSNGATSASIDQGIGAVTPAAGGSRAVSPGSTTTYTLTCTNAAGSNSQSATITVIPELTATCSVTPTTATTGDAVTWTAAPTGGTGVYTYAWSGNDAQTTGSTQSITPAYSSAGNKTATVTITSGAQSVPVTCSNSVTVSAAAQPNLTVQVAPTGNTSVTVGTVTSYSGATHNNGTATATNYPNVLQVLDAAGTTNLGYFAATPATVTTAPNGDSAVSGTVPGSGSPFATAGTYQVRFCANMNTSGVHIITEVPGGYGDNCGLTTTVTVSAATPPTPTCTLSASPTNAVPSTLTWSSTNATSCTGGGFSTGSATDGNTTVNTEGTYTLNCSGGGGSCTTSASISTSCTGTGVANITANPMRVKAGSPSTITWDATNITESSPSCTISGPGLSRSATASPLPLCAVPSDSATVVINAQSTYIISCSDGTEKSVTVNVVPEFVEF